jgi:hypothetical protein
VRLLAMLHAYPEHHNAGAEWMVHTLLRAAVERGHEVDVVLSNPAPCGCTRSGPRATRSTMPTTRP